MNSRQAGNQILCETSTLPSSLQISNFQANSSSSPHLLHLDHTKCLVDFQRDQPAPQRHSWTQPNTWLTHPWILHLPHAFTLQHLPLNFAQLVKVAYIHLHHLFWTLSLEWNFDTSGAEWRMPLFAGRQILNWLIRTGCFRLLLRLYIVCLPLECLRMPGAFHLLYVLFTTHLESLHLPVNSWFWKVCYWMSESCFWPFR